MRSSLVAVSFAAAAFAQSTVVTELTDGQPQAPTYTNPFTSYLTETNSLGVVTGQPTVETSIASVVTSQASVITSQAAPATSQTAAATFISGSPGIPVSVPLASSSIIPPLGSPPVVGSASGFSTAPAGANATVSTQSVPSVTGSASGTASGTASGSSSESATGASGSGSTGTTAAGASTTSRTASGAMAMVQPVLSLGFAAAFFALFL